MIAQNVKGVFSFSPSSRLMPRGEIKMQWLEINRQRASESDELKVFCSEIVAKIQQSCAMSTAQKHRAEQKRDEDERKVSKKFQLDDIKAKLRYNWHLLNKQHFCVNDDNDVIFSIHLSSLAHPRETAETEERARKGNANNMAEEKEREGSEDGEKGMSSLFIHQM
jgi:hypothetical protein